MPSRNFGNGQTSAKARNTRLSATTPKGCTDSKSVLHHWSTRTTHGLQNPPFPPLLEGEGGISHRVGIRGHGWPPVYEPGGAGPFSYTGGIWGGSDALDAGAGRGGRGSRPRRQG